MWPVGFVAPWHLGSSRIRDQTRVSCIRKVDSLPLSHQESPITVFFTCPETSPGQNNNLAETACITLVHEMRLLQLPVTAQLFLNISHVSFKLAQQKMGSEVGESWKEKSHVL